MIDYFFKKQIYDSHSVIITGKWMLLELNSIIVLYRIDVANKFQRSFVFGYAYFMW